MGAATHISARRVSDSAGNVTELTSGHISSVVAMLSKLLDFLLGRKEPRLNEADKDRRLRVMAQRLEVIQRGRK